MAFDINNHLPDIFEYLCETACLHLVYCIPRLMSSKPTPKAHASWTDTNITQLISFLYEHQAEGTDRGFKKSTYVAAAEDLAPHCHKGGEKNWESCKWQWTKVRSNSSSDYLLMLLLIAQKLAQTCLYLSGFIWICLGSKP